MWPTVLVSFAAGCPNISQVSSPRNSKEIPRLQTRYISAASSPTSPDLTANSRYFRVAPEIPKKYQDCKLEYPHIARLDCKLEIFLRRVAPHRQVNLILPYQSLHIFPVQLRKEPLGGWKSITGSLTSIVTNVATSLAIFCLVDFLQLFNCLASFLLLMPQCLPDESEMRIE